MTERRIAAVLVLLGLATIGGESAAAPDRAKAPPAAPPATSNTADLATAVAESSKVKPAPERTLAPPPAKAPIQKSRATSKGAGSRPVYKGVKVPDALLPQMKAQMDARVDQDLLKIKGLRAEATALLTTFVAESPKDTREMPEALLRLGELKWEVEREGFVDRFRAWEATPMAKRGPAPEPDFAPSRELFGRVLRDYPRFGDYDLALYVDGFLATEQGKQEEAVERFDRILKEFPRSRFVPDAHMARGEFLFGTKNDYVAALSEYDEVLKYKASDLHGLALFKSAWCLWRLGRNDEAVRRFVSVFEVTDSEGKAATTNRRKDLDELQSEALKYLVEVFTEDDRNSASDMYRFLTKIGGDRFAVRIVKALATQFYDTAHYERGIEAYELLLKLDPTNPEAAEWMVAIAQGYYQIEDFPHTRQTWERALATHTAGGPWARTQADPEVVARATARMEEVLRQQAIELHGKAQRDKNSRAEFEGAEGLYLAYLSRFAKEPKAYQMQFYAAEIDFYRLEKNTDAATLYLAAARGVPRDTQDKDLLQLRRDALYNGIAALERVRVAELEARKGGKQPTVETETDKKFAEALELYATLYPKDPALPELFFRQGKLYYDYSVYDPAVKIWGTLLEKFPSSPYASSAGELILDSFNRSKNYENIEVWARRLKTVPAFQTAKQQERLDALIVQAVFKQGEQKAAAGDHQGAGRAYLRAAQEFPKDQRAAQALVNAALSAQKAGDLSTLKAAGQLSTSKEYRDRPESPQGAWIAGSTMQSMGLFGEAADFEEGIVANADREHPHYQKFEHTRDAAYNTVILRVATGENDKAVANGQRYLKDYGNTAEADEVVFQMGKAHQNAGRHREAADLYKRFLAGRTKNADHRVQGHVLLAQALLKVGDEKGADQSLAQAVAIGKKQKRELGPDGKYSAAQARYLEGERVLAKFEQIQIQGDVKQLSGRLKKKSELLKQAATIFLDVVALGVAEWSTAALYQIGRTYELFSKSLREAPPPSNLSEPEKEAFTQQIEEFVVPIEERSLDAYENGWRKAVELGIYNQWTAKMRDALGRLNGELYPPFKEVGFEVRSAGPSPLPQLIAAPRKGTSGEAEKADVASAEKPAEKATSEKGAAVEASKPEAAPTPAPGPTKPAKPAKPPKKGRK